jgi:cell wall-associated protease
MISAIALFIYSLLCSHAATIAIIDTGFDLDHDFLKPKILKQETDEEAINPSLKTVRDWRFHDNSHLKDPVIKDKSLLQEVLLYRNLRAKGHQEGLSLAEFEWFKNKSSDQEFMNQVKIFKKHAHGTFVAGIALREGDNINLFPIRGLHLPSPVIAVNTSSKEVSEPLKSITPDEKFKESIQKSEDRVVKKFAKICRYLSLNQINVVNASYGITYKNISSRFREKYKELTGLPIEELRLENIVNLYFEKIQDRSQKIINKYPKMLFVFSAGNSGLDNDLFPHYPSRIKQPNTIAVGAMNGDYIASFSNFGKKHVDIGAPGVAILSLVPSAYSLDGKNIYSPSSGTSMAAPYISNLAAQILNINLKLSPEEIKKIILETGDVKEHLKEKMISAAIVNNDRAIKAALLSKDLPLEQAIGLAKTGLVPIEDSVSFGQPPAVEPLKIQQQVMDSIPKSISPQEIEEIQETQEDSSKPLESETKVESAPLSGTSN